MTLPGVDPRTNSATVTLHVPPRGRSATRGPTTTTLTLTTNVELVAEPGAAHAIYVTRIKAGNSSATLVRLDIVEGGTVGGVDGTVVDSQPLAANGGGYRDDFVPAYQLPANTRLCARLSAGVTDVRVNTHFFTSP